MEIYSDVDISPFSGLRIRSRARRFASVTNLSELERVSRYALEHHFPFTTIGEGTNTLWGNSPIERVIAKMEIPGFEILKEDPKHLFIRVGAGERWDTVVERLVGMNLSGAEALSAIPGSAGATPIQNVGAYGSEIRDILESVTAYDLESGKLVEITCAECRFGYRDSIFKHEAKDKLVITSLVLRLSQEPPHIPQYKDVIEYFKNRKDKPSAQEIREAIKEIRKRKLPDPRNLPNCGSFFKNPILSKESFDTLAIQFPDIPRYPSGHFVKVPAGWLIETAGLKGARIGPLTIYEHNALVLTAPETSPAIEDVETAVETIRKKVKEMFGIILEQEPITVT
jgi:UDP-N-acetylmuramate dehydrogenase